MFERGRRILPGNDKEIGEATARNRELNGGSTDPYNRFEEARRENKKRADEIAAKLTGLNDEEREVIKLMFFGEGNSAVTTARLLGKSVEEVNRLLASAIRKLGKNW